MIDGVLGAVRRANASSTGRKRPAPAGDADADCKDNMPTAAIEAMDAGAASASAAAQQQQQQQQKKQSVQHLGCRDMLTC